MAFWPDGTSGQQFSFRNDGRFPIRVQNENGCVRWDTVIVLVLSSDSIFDLFDSSDTSVCQQNGLSINFLDLPGDLFWSDGRGSKLRTLYNSGTYILRYEEDCLTIRDTLNLEAIDCDTCEFWMPDAFSPNNDGLNDQFRLKSYCDFEYFELIISNRWGQQVFYSNDQNLHWDGTFNGRDCSAGIYLYDLRYKLEFKDTKRLQGHLLLMH